MFITRGVLKGDVSVYEGYRIGGEYFALFIAVFSTTGSASVLRKPKKECGSRPSMLGCMPLDTTNA